MEHSGIAVRMAYICKLYRLVEACDREAQDDLEDLFL